MRAPNEKLHLGLISTSLERANLFKDALGVGTGGYIHLAKDHLEMHSKLNVQRIDMLIYDCDAKETGDRAQAIVQFFRNKHSYTKMPIGLVYPGDDFEMKYLITDPRVRGFNRSVGELLVLMSLQKFVDAPDTKEIEPLPQEWISTEFLNSIVSKVGSELHLHPAPATDDDLHSEFLCQTHEEIRSHLAWVKFAVRILEKQEDGFSKIFPGLDHEMSEEVGTNLLNQICKDFHSKMKAELKTRGALFFPPIESLPPADRKQLYSSSKTTNFLFSSPEIAIVLEMIRYL